MIKPKPLRLEPIAIDESTWYYEEPDGIVVCREIYDKEYIRTDQFTIRWKLLLESIGRKYGTR
jgi:hypothetical protein